MQTAPGLTENKPIPQPLGVKEFLAMRFPPQKWIFGKTVPVGGLVALSGVPGSYKSFFALWMALRAGMGKPLYDVPCGLGDNDKAWRTLFVEEENSLPLMYGRLTALEHEGADNVFFKVDHGFRMTDDEARANMAGFCLLNSIDLVVLDPFSSVMGLSDENSNAEVSLVMDTIRKTFVANGITVMFIHHPSKNSEGGKNLRGAGDILGKCDVHLSMEKNEMDKKLVTVSYEKMRLIADDEVWNHKVRFLGDSLLGQCKFKYEAEAKPKHEEERDKLTEAILKSLQPGVEYSRKEIAENIGVNNSGDKFATVWNNLIEKGLIKQNITTKKFHT